MMASSTPSSLRRVVSSTDRPEEGWARFKEGVVALCKPLLKAAFQSGALSKDAYKQVLKRTAEKVVGGYKKEGLPPPTVGELPPSQRDKIEGLALEYVGLLSSKPA